MPFPPNLARDRNPNYGNEQLRVQVNNAVASLRHLTAKLDADAGVAGTNYRATITDASVGTAPRKIVDGQFDPASELPALGALVPGQPGFWCDSTTGLSDEMWADRLNGLVLPVVGGGVTTVESNALNGRPAARFNATAVYGAVASPIGANPAALSLICVAGHGRAVGNMLPCGLGKQFVGLVGTELSFEVAGASLDTLVFFVDAVTIAGEGTLVLVNSTTPGAMGDGVAVMELYIDAPGVLPRCYGNGVDLGADLVSGALPFADFGFDAITIGGYEPTLVSGRFRGDVFLVVALPVALSVADRQVIYDWITSVYGIALPAAA